MTSPVFSVIIAAYNISGYIEECMGSILPADPTWEILIVDDGSTDGTGEICDRLVQSLDNIRVIHKENGGLSSARNCGLKSSRGEYIVFVDGDDRIDRRILCRLAECIQKKPDVVFSEIRKVWDDGREKPMGDGITHEIDDLKGESLTQYLADIKKLPGSACGKAFRREFLISNDLFFREGILSEDIEWSFRVYCLAYSAVYCGDVLYFYRKGREGSITAKGGSKHALDLLSIEEEYSDKLNKMGKDTAVKNLYRSFLEYELRQLLIKRNDVEGEDRAAFRKRLKKLKALTGYRKDIKSRLVALLYRVLI